MRVGIPGCALLAAGGTASDCCVSVGVCFTDFVAELIRGQLPGPDLGLSSLYDKLL